jgi:hypothetical protein
MSSDASENLRVIRTIRVAEVLYWAAQFAFQPGFAIRDLSLQLVGIQLGQDFVIGGVSADRNKPVINRLQFFPAHNIELLALLFSRNKVWRGFAQSLFDFDAIDIWRALQPLNDCFYLHGSHFKTFSEPAPFFLRHPRQARSTLVVPKPASRINESRANEKRGWSTEFFQDRVSRTEVVAQTIIERER